MAAEYDLVIRRGTVADGTGDGLRAADVAIEGDRIAAVGTVSGRGREEIDAAGLLVTPGFVDIHTHYDGQVTWDARLAPSSHHGVTTVLMGNCGVGFAPCRPQEREMLIALMEGVEDIPEVVLTAGIPWAWETFPEYLDWLARRSYDVDFAAQVPHSAVRVYAMGKRGADREPATPADMARMKGIVQDGVRAGALGFSTSRTRNHRTKAGSLAPSITADEAELTAIARGLREIGAGVMEVVDDWADLESAFAMWERIAGAAARPLSFNNTERGQNDPDFARRLELVRAANASGKQIRMQSLPRPIGVMLGLDLSYHPFAFSDVYAAIAALPLDERVAAMRRPELRERLLAESYDESRSPFGPFTRKFETIFVLGDPPDYAPAPDRSIAAMAKRAGRSALDLAYDLLLENGGRQILYLPAANYAGFSLDTQLRMLQSPDSVFGLGDGGAHCGLICDASATTYLLTYWTRDRAGEKISVAEAVRKLTSETSRLVGFADRGVLAPGYKADVNVIDYDALYLHPPRMVADLPSNGRRLMQHADGYVATVKSGQVTYRNGVATGALPGRLVRGAQPAPQAAVA